MINPPFPHTYTLLTPQSPSLHPGINSYNFDPHAVAVDYRGVGFRECAAEVARYLVAVEGLDLQDPLRVRLLGHLQCYSAQREAAAKASLQGGGAASWGVASGMMGPMTGAVGGVMGSHHTNPSGGGGSISMGGGGSFAPPTQYGGGVASSMTTPMMGGVSGGILPGQHAGMHQGSEQPHHLMASMATSSTVTPSSSSASSSLTATSSSTPHSAGLSGSSIYSSTGSTAAAFPPGQHGGSSHHNQHTDSILSGHMRLAAASSSAASNVGAAGGTPLYQANAGLGAAPPSSQLSPPLFSTLPSLHPHPQFPALNVNPVSSMMSHPSSTYQHMGLNQANTPVKPYRPWGGELAY